MTKVRRELNAEIEGIISSLRKVTEQTIKKQSLKLAVQLQKAIKKYDTKTLRDFYEDQLDKFLYENEIYILEENGEVIFANGKVLFASEQN